MHWKLIRNLLAVAATALASASALSQEWPSRPITWVVPFAAGGNFDLVARIVAKELGADLKQAVIIDNKAGAGGMLGASVVARAKPDGYTFLVGGNGVVTNTLMRSDQPFKDEDLTPVAPLSVAPSVTVTSPDSPFKTLREFVDDAKAKNIAKVPFATAGVGSSPHFVAGLFKIASGVDIEPIQYKSGQETILAVAGGQVPLASESVSVVAPLVQAGRVKALAVTLTHRSPLLPQVPTAKEQGLDAMEMGHFVGIWAPAAVPVEILNRMNAAINKVLAMPQVKQAYAASGTETMIQTRPVFIQAMKDERERLKKVVAAAGMSDQ
ncbi:MAG: tripartite tricarboxylate transporter substrate binding protein [Pseudomonadota bacterium]